MKEKIIQPKSIGGFIRSISGLFITKENPHGLSPKECSMLSILRTQLTDPDKELTKEMKQYVSDQLNQTSQVTTNYINIFKKKGVLIDNKLHPIFYTSKIIIEYGESTV